VQVGAPIITQAMGRPIASKSNSRTILDKPSFPARPSASTNTQVTAFNDRDHPVAQGDFVKRRGSAVESAVIPAILSAADRPRHGRGGYWIQEMSNAGFRRAFAIASISR